jgi:hypothetical protein
MPDTAQGGPSELDHRQVLCNGDVFTETISIVCEGGNPENDRLPSVLNHTSSREIIRFVERSLCAWEQPIPAVIVQYRKLFRLVVSSR